MVAPRVVRVVAAMDTHGNKVTVQQLMRVLKHPVINSPYNHTEESHLATLHHRGFSTEVATAYSSISPNTTTPAGPVHSLTSQTVQPSQAGT